MIRRALLSVSNKNGIVEFAKRLYGKGIEILSTGGTARLLRANDIDVVDVSAFTGFPELASGVKTLHPKIHGALLAKRNNAPQLKEASQNDIQLIDLLVANLSPLNLPSGDDPKTIDKALESVDIGGPSLLRSAAKNYRSVTVVSDPADYNLVIQEIEANGDTNEATRKRLAEKVFETTTHYDGLVAEFLTQGRIKHITLKKVGDLRHGENPHQSATLYRDMHPAPHHACVPNAIQLQGRPLSYTNALDADTALALLRPFNKPGVAFVKHGSPCGVSIVDDLNDAFLNAYQGDPRCVSGGLLALNRRCTADLAEAIVTKDFFGVLAPDFDDKALTVFKKKKDLPVLKVGEITPEKAGMSYRKISGGAVVQETDTRLPTEQDLTVVTKKEPTPKQVADLLFAWVVAKHTRTNAVVVAKNGMTVGIGEGQTSREAAVDLALRKAHGRLKNSVLASDGALDNASTIRALGEAGVKAILQPGRSSNDAAVTTAADDAGIAMAFTGYRAFLH